MFGGVLAHVRFRGTIREHAVEPYLQVLKVVREKRKVRGLLFDMSSGGGDGVSSSDLYRAVKRVAAVKPVVATIGGGAASGGYMAVLGAHRIYAHPESDVGSIGVFIPHIVARGLLDKVGIKVELLHYGRHKDAYQGLRELTDEERQKVLKVAEVGYQSFVDQVARERKKSREEALQLATGEYWSGAQALGLGLIDALGDREDALEELSRRTGVSSRKAVEFAPRRPFLDRLLSGPMNRVGTSLADAVYTGFEDRLEDLLVNHGRFR